MATTEKSFFIPTKVSALENDKGYLIATDLLPGDNPNPNPEVDPGEETERLKEELQRLKNISEKVSGKNLVAAYETVTNIQSTKGRDTTATIYYLDQLENKQINDETWHNFERPVFRINLKEPLKAGKYILSFKYHINEGINFPQFQIYTANEWSSGNSYSKNTFVYKYSLNNSQDENNNLIENFYKSQNKENRAPLNNIEWWKSVSPDSDDLKISEKFDLSQPFYYLNNANSVEDEKITYEQFIKLELKSEMPHNHLYFIECIDNDNIEESDLDIDTNRMRHDNIIQNINSDDEPIEIEIFDIKIEQGEIPTVYEPSIQDIRDEAKSARNLTHAYIEQGTADGWASVEMEGTHMLASTPILLKNVKLLSTGDKKGLAGLAGTYSNLSSTDMRISEHLYIPFPFPCRYNHLLGVVDRGLFQICNVNGLGGRASVGAKFRLATPCYQDGQTISQVVLRLFMAERRHSVPKKPEIPYNEDISNEIVRYAMSYVKQYTSAENNSTDDTHQWEYGANIIYGEKQYKARSNNGLINNINGNSVMECDTFVGMVLRGIPYYKSPYYSGYTGIGTDNETDPNLKWSEHVKTGWEFRAGPAVGWYQTHETDRTNNSTYLKESNGKQYYSDTHEEVQVGDIVTKNGQEKIYFPDANWNMTWLDYSKNSQIASSSPVTIQGEGWFYIPGHLSKWVRDEQNPPDNDIKRIIGEFDNTSIAIGALNDEASDEIYQISVDEVDTSKLNGYAWLMKYTAQDAYDLPYWAKELRMKIASDVFHKCFVRDSKYAADLAWSFWQITTHIGVTQYKYQIVNNITQQIFESGSYYIKNGNNYEPASTYQQDIQYYERVEMNPSHTIGCIFKDPQYAKPGDVAFFRSADAGKWFDQVGHIAIVIEEADEDGNVTVAEITGANTSGGRVLHARSVYYVANVREMYFARPYGWYNPDLWAKNWDAVKNKNIWNNDSTSWAAEREQREAEFQALNYR